jgi:hypothetical protein
MSNRPTYNNKEVNIRAAKKLTSSLGEWGTPEELEKSLVAALMSCQPSYDAYKLASCLDRDHGWSSNKDLVDLLDATDFIAHSNLYEVISDWVIANGIKPKRSIGDAVRLKTPGARGVSADVDGEIISIDEAHAQYIVRIPSLGHVSTGIGTHGVIINFEEIHDLATPAEEFTLLPY